MLVVNKGYVYRLCMVLVLNKGYLWMVLCMTCTEARRCRVVPFQGAQVGLAIRSVSVGRR